MSLPRKIKSDFAILDVKTGQSGLSKHFENRPRNGPCPAEMRVPVTITGYIDNIWGSYDGVSREFSVHVDKVKIGDSNGN